MRIIDRLGLRFGGGNAVASVAPAVARKEPVPPSVSVVGSMEQRSTPAMQRSLEEIVALLDKSGARGVSLSAAMQVAPVMACARLICNGVATPALHVFRDDTDGRRRKAVDLPVYRLLNRRPNEWQTSFEFRRTMTLHAVLTPGALALKVMVGGQLRELIPVRPGFFQVDEVSRYEWRFRVWDEFGPIGVFGPSDVFYLPNLQWDSIEGMDAVRLARSAIGLAMAAESNQASLHENGGRASGILSTDQALTPELVDRIRTAWADFLRTNRNGTAVLDAGMKYTALTMSGVDAEHLATRRFQVEEVCRAFDVFPMMIGHVDKTATFASSEAFFSAHLKHTIAPWHEMWRQRLDEFVLDGEGPLYADFDTRYLTMGSMADRAQYARTMIEMGAMTRNEWRDDEGRDPLPGLDEPLTPMNMVVGGASSGTTQTGTEGDPTP